MSDIIVTLNLLNDGLIKKEKALIDILNYTQAQSELLGQDPLDLKTFNNIMKNKQFRIDAIKQIDEGFQPAYERIRVHLEKQPDLYRDYIKKIQVMIKKTGELGLQIQVEEQKNHTKFKMITQSMKGDVKNFRTQKKTVSNYYNNFNKQHDSVRTNLFDSKK